MTLAEFCQLSVRNPQESCQKSLYIQESLGPPLAYQDRGIWSVLRILEEEPRVDTCNT